jgi:hypothetical protein
MITLARLISFIFNPYFLLFPMPFLLVLRETNDPYYALIWALVSTGFIGIVGGIVFILMLRGTFTDLDISKREQRPLFFLLLSLAAACYLITLYLFQGPIILFLALSGIFFSLIIFSLVNTRIKASMHVASIAALIFVLSILYNGVHYLILFLIPLIAWSRIKIKRHTTSEAIVGGITGLSIAVFLYIVFRYIMVVPI